MDSAKVLVQAEKQTDDSHIRYIPTVLYIRQTYRQTERQTDRQKTDFDIFTTTEWCWGEGDLRGTLGPKSSYFCT